MFEYRFIFKDAFVNNFMKCLDFGVPEIVRTLQESSNEPFKLIGSDRTLNQPIRYSNGRVEVKIKREYGEVLDFEVRGSQKYDILGQSHIRELIKDATRFGKTAGYYLLGGGEEGLSHLARFRVELPEKTLDYLAKGVKTIEKMQKFVGIFRIGKDRAMKEMYDKSLNDLVEIVDGKPLPEYVVNLLKGKHGFGSWQDVANHLNEYGVDVDAKTLSHRYNYSWKGKFKGVRGRSFSKRRKCT